MERREKEGQQRLNGMKNGLDAHHKLTCGCG